MKKVVVKALSEKLEKDGFASASCWNLACTLLVDFAADGNTSDFTEEFALKQGLCGSGSYYSLLERLIGHNYIVLVDDKLKSASELDVFLKQYQIRKDTKNISSPSVN